MIIAITGIDGSGKTTIAKSLADVLVEKGYKTIYHEEFKYTFLNILLRWFFGKRLPEARDAYFKRKNKRSFIYKFWPYLLYIDCLVTYLKYHLFHRDKITVFDRYFYDFIVAFEGLGDLNIMVRKLFFSLPQPDMGFMLNIPARLSYERRKGEYPPKSLEWFESWHNKYARLNDKIKFKNINSDNQTAVTLNKILKEIMPLLPQDSNIIEVFNNCPYENRRISGADCRVMEYCSFFKKKGYRIHLYIHQAIKKRYIDKGYRITVTSNINGRRWGAFITYFWNGIRGCLLQKKEPVSIIYSSHGLADVLPAIFRKLRTPSAKWMSGFHLIAPNPLKGYQGAIIGKYRFPTLSGIYQFFYQRLIMMFMKRLTALVMVSNHIDRNFFLRKGFKISQVMVVYGGVNWDDLNQSHSEAKKYDASFIGRIHPQKGIPDLLEIWRKVCQKKRNAKLVMIGRLEILKNEIQRLGLDNNIELLGFLEGKKKFQVLKLSKIFLLPSYYEGCSLVTCEAMACGLPVLAYDLPMLKEVYPRGMVRIPIGDVEKFSEEIINLLLNNQRWEILSGEAKEISSQFDWTKNAKMILERLQDKRNN